MGIGWGCLVLELFSELGDSSAERVFSGILEALHLEYLQEKNRS